MCHGKQSLWQQPRQEVLKFRVQDVKGDIKIVPRSCTHCVVHRYCHSYDTVVAPESV